MFSRRNRQSVADGATYEEWVAYLDAFARGDVHATAVLAPLPEAIGDQAVIRLNNRAVQAVGDRLKLWSKNFDRNVGNHRSVVEFERILAQSRDQIASVWEFTHSAALPHTILSNLQSQVKDQIEKTQESLEGQFDRDQQNRAAYELAVRRASLLAVLRGEVTSSTAKAIEAEASSPSGRSRRKILIQKEADPNA